MPTLANDEIYEVKFYFNYANQVAQNVLHYRISAVAGSPTDAMLADVLDTTFAPAFGDCLSQHATYAGVGVSRLRPLPRTIPVYDNDGEGAGGVLGDPLPKQVCGVITKRTALAGVRFRGRMYVPFPGEADNEATTGIPSVGYVANLDVLGALLDNVLAVGAGGNTASANPVLWNRATTTPTVQAETFTPITGFRSRGIWGTQRRRGDYGATNQLPFELL